MKRREFVRELTRQGCYLKRHGGKHDLYMNRANGRTVPVPRHPEIRDTLARGIDLRNRTATVLNQSPDQSGMGNGTYIYQGSVPATESGTYGFSVRVVPTHLGLMQAHELRLITWS